MGSGLKRDYEMLLSIHGDVVTLTRKAQLLLSIAALGITLRRPRLRRLIRDTDA